MIGPNKRAQREVVQLSQTQRFNRDAKVDQLISQLSVLESIVEQQSGKIRYLESQLAEFATRIDNS